jgi:hypothetical protein
MPDPVLIEAYDTRTGEVLPNLVPAEFVEKGSPFPYLGRTAKGGRSTPAEPLGPDTLTAANATEPPTTAVPAENQE